MNEPALKTTIFEAAAAVRRLRELGLPVEKITRVLAEGEYNRAQATEHDPVNAGGLDAYRYRVRAMRDQFCPLGWTIGRDGGLESIVSPCGSRQIITRSGDADVGIRAGHPAPKGAIGESAGKRIAGNTALLFDPSYLNNSDVARPAFETWMLLVYRSGDVCRAELSFPSNVPDDDSRPLAWFERILLPDLDLNDPSSGREYDSNASAPVVDVPVIRKR